MIREVRRVKECYNLKEYFLDELQYRGLAATFFLLNGFQLKGVLLHYDDNVLVVQSGDKRQMVYQQAISTIAPAELLEFPSEY